MTFEQHATVVARLALHQLQRGQSIPTLSVLIGKTIAARQLWTQCLDKTNRQTAVCVYKSKATLFESWMVVVSQHYDLRSLAIERVATLVGQPVEQLAAWLINTSDYQMRLFWQRVLPLSAEIPLLRSLLDSLPPSKTSNQPSKSISAGWLKEEESSAVLRKFAAVTQLLPSQSVPGLLVLLPDPDEAISAVNAALTSLIQIVEAVPAIPIGLVLTSAQEKLLLNKLPESRAKATLRSGLTKIPSLESDNLRKWLSDRGVKEQHLQPVLHLAEARGATTETLETALALTDRADRASTDEADTVFRSQAEKFLSDYLESNPKTVGRFQINARLDFNFGDRCMEVDFVDAAAKIVVELDGYYHFQSLDNYRRDRRKDRLLQQRGFLVLRFLSEDVVSKLEEILDIIEQTIALRQSQITNHSEI